MIINENVLKFMFSRNNVLRVIMYLLCVYLALLAGKALELTHLYVSDYLEYDKKIDEVYNMYDNNEGILSLYRKCKSIDCAYAGIVDNDVVHLYTFSNDIKAIEAVTRKSIKDNNLEINDNSEIYAIEYLSNSDAVDMNLSDVYLFGTFKYFTKDLNFIVYYNDKMYIVTHSKYISNAIIPVVLLSIVLTMISVYIFILNNYAHYRTQQYEKNEYKMYMENKVQANMTEMLHHEINAPLAILKTTNDELSEYINCAPKGSKDLDYKLNLVKSFEFAVDRIDAILGVLYDVRKVKKFEEVSSIKDIIDVTMLNINKFNIKKLRLDYTNSNILDKYSVSSELTTGGFMNVLYVLINNSLEAKATTITIDTSIVNDKYLNLYVGDNGTGIRDNTNRIFKGNTLFRYGYSSKDKDGNHIEHDSILVKVLRMLGVKTIRTETGRGIGLYMNKMVMTKAKGDIILEKTDTTGTVFKLLVPVVKKKK